MAVAIAGPDGEVPRENSSGKRKRQGSIAKTGSEWPPDEEQQQRQEQKLSQE
ncbi:MAG: hypothetical protein ACYDC6_08695 [Acidobacteriaceae bacterium]